jgi:hypothetical protein
LTGSEVTNRVVSAVVIARLLAGVEVSARLWRRRIGEDFYEAGIQLRALSNRGFVLP